ncbi:flagellar export protein FliJ [Rhizobiales bacterium]|uniref:flagellar export protein FliJ n=1 Tax=Hongsoonwoonella zoysiae TaxID=2821844 RepID=UPI0015605D6F|nr:flagellar export protein FliJ [Hongsoonwoonella zoysiae]NRG17421.1 flagellar export protein FliJ [Hongsoonwoonella zoysiae]
MKSRGSLIRLKKFQVDEKRRQVTQIESMIAEFMRMAEELDEQIRAEQTRVGISDVTHFAYPTFAKAAAQRRDNLVNSAGELKEQLERAQDELTEAVEDLKKFELMEERDLLREKSEAEVAEQDQLDEIAQRGRAQGF